MQRKTRNPFIQSGPPPPRRPMIRSPGGGLGSGGAVAPVPSGGTLGSATGSEAVVPRTRAVLPKIPEEQEAQGGALRSGGSVQSAGGFGVGVGGSVRSGGGLSGADMSVRQQYHSLMKMHQHDWEAMREAASQSLGNAPSHMWGPIPVPKFEGEMHHMRNVARAHSPHIAAKLLEAEHAHQGEGGGFRSAIRHVLKAVRDHAGALFKSSGLKEALKETLESKAQGAVQELFPRDDA